MYIFLSFITLLTFYLTSVRFRSFKEEPSINYYLKILILPILLYTITYGLRYGWLVDFQVYEYHYKTLHNVEEKMGWLSQLLMFAGHYGNIDYNWFIVLMSLIFICTYLLAMKPFYRWLPIIFLWFYLMNFMAAQFVVFYPAMGLFVLALGLYLQSDNKYDFRGFVHNGLWKPLVLLIIAFGLHKGIVIALLFVPFVLLIKVRPLYAISVYALSFFFIQEWWIEIINYVSLYVNLETNDTFSYFNHYLSNAEGFFNDGTHEITNFGYSTMYLIRTFLSNAAAIYLYYRYQKLENPSIYKYRILELSTIGLVLYNMCYGTEILNRYALLFLLYVPVMYGIAFKYAFKSEKMIYKGVAVMSILSLLYTWLDLFFSRTNPEFIYIWDK